MIYLCIFTSNVYLLIYTSSIYIFIHLWYLRISISLSVFQTYLFLYILCLGLKDIYRQSQKIFNLEYDFGSFLRVNKIHSIKTNICGKNLINLIKSMKELKRINRLAFLKKLTFVLGSNVLFPGLTGRTTQTWSPRDYVDDFFIHVFGTPCIMSRT